MNFNSQELILTVEVSFFFYSILFLFHGYTIIFSLKVLILVLGGPFERYLIVSISSEFLFLRGLVCFFLSFSPGIPDCPLRTSLQGTWADTPLTSLGPWLSVPRNRFSLAVHFLGKEPSDLLPGQGEDKPAARSQAGAEKGQRVFLSPTVDFYFCAPAFPCPWHRRGQKVTEWGVDVGVSLLLRFSPNSPVIGHLHVQRSLIPETFLGSMPKLS